MFTANPIRIVTVSSLTPTTQCLGTQVGRYATSSAGLVALGGCNQNCQSGPSSSTTQCGTSLGVPTWCCYKPVFYWSAAQALAAPATGVTAYPYISVPVTVRTLPQMCAPPPFPTARTYLASAPPMALCP